MLQSSVLSWRVSQAWNPCQIQLSPGNWSLWLSQALVHLLWSLCWCCWCCLSSAWSSLRWSSYCGLWRDITIHSNEENYIHLKSPRAHLHVVGMLFWHKPTELVHFFVSVFMALSSVFHFITSPDNSPLSHSVLPVLFLPYWSCQLYVSYESLFQTWYNLLWLTGLKAPTN